MTKVVSREVEIIKEALGKAGFNPTRYKASFLKRRITAAFRRSGVKSREEFLEQLKKNPEELKKLTNFFSINVTRFFRNQDTFEILEKRFLPQLVAEKLQANNSAIKVWSVGCATGAEPYTFAIMFVRILGDSLAQINVRILGTDVNPYLLQIAEKGIYPEGSVEEVPHTIRKMYFRNTSPELFQISPTIQQMVHFRIHDLLKDPPFKQQDVIVCRNVLIYFSRQSQDKIYEEFTTALKHHGLLILGRTEILPTQYRTWFKILDKKHRIYQKIREWG